jgi:hypothetical protein
MTQEEEIRSCPIFEMKKILRQPTLSLFTSYFFLK